MSEAVEARVGPSPGLRAVALSLVLAASSACGSPAEKAAPPPAAGFAEQAASFPRGITEVAPGVHVAVGFGLGNSVLLVGEGGNVVVDTLESAEAAAPLADEFRRISSAPVAAIVYTHNHADHIFGAATLAGDDEPEVIVHESFDEELARLVTTRNAVWRRSMRQFGVGLREEERQHCGIGPKLEAGAKTTPVPLAPTRRFAGERLEVTIAGIRMLLLHLPGETPDHVAVWLPDKGVLLAGDNYYHSFPNLYAIRGSPVRELPRWIASIDAMRSLGASILVPGHTLPVSGADEVRERLTSYRDAVQYVHDQTLRHMNEGRTPDEIVELVKLPAALAAKPWLAERYGRVDWSVRGVFDANLGWFGGDAAELSPMTRREHAQHLVALAGGSEKLRDAAKQALSEGQARWALELAGHLQALGEFTDVAKRVRAQSLRLLAAEESSANGRNYYLSQALEAEETLSLEPPDPAATPDALLAAIPVRDFLRAMTLRLDPAKAEGKTLAVGLRFPDLEEEWGMTLRNNVVELAEGLPARADMTVTTDSLVWKEILSRKRNATAAFASGAVEVDRNRLELVRFLFLFQ